MKSSCAIEELSWEERLDPSGCTRFALALPGQWNHKISTTIGCCIYDSLRRVSSNGALTPARRKRLTQTRSDSEILSAHLSFEMHRTRAGSTAHCDEDRSRVHVACELQLAFSFSDTADNITCRRIILLTMSQFRAKKLDLGGFVNIRVIRDHTKRKVFAQYEQERSVYQILSKTAC